jgi:hypothetical protein
MSTQPQQAPPWVTVLPVPAAAVAYAQSSAVVCCDPAGAHYYCETLDISRPFPSERPAHQPSWPFVWNKALSMPFRSAGLDGLQTVCPALLQVLAGLQFRGRDSS